MAVTVFVLVAVAALIYLGLWQYESSRRAEDLMEQGAALANRVLEFSGDGQTRFRNQVWEVADELRMASRGMALTKRDLNRISDLIRRVRIATTLEAKSQFLNEIRRVIEQGLDRGP